nr:Uncharacterised protein [Klebsiella pneumoniae]
MLFKVEMTVNIPLGFPANEAEEIKNAKSLFATITAGRQMAAYLARCRPLCQRQYFRCSRCRRIASNINGIAAISLYGDKSGSPLSSSVINSR